MLTIDHRAYHLYRDDAYYEYGMEVDKHSAYIPPSFIYLSFQAFKDACAKYGLSLSSRSIRDERMMSPWVRKRQEIPESIKPLGLIFRVGIDEDATAAQEALKDGRNVLALVPDASRAFPYHDQGEPTPEAFQSAASMLGIDPEGWALTRKSYWDSKTLIHWEEIETETTGRLFVTRDAFLSDGFFLEGYGFSVENQNEIQSLIKAFACFKTNLIRLSYRNVVQSWPTGEPLTVTVDVFNHGPDCGEVTLSIEIGLEFEALSPLERKILPLHSLKRTSFALQLVPCVDGNFPIITGASALLEDGSSCTVNSSELNLDVSPALESSQRSSVPQDDGTLSKLSWLREVLGRIDTGEDVSNLLELAQLDIKACLNRIRSVTEKIVFNYTRKNSIPHNANNLENAISALKKYGSFSDRTIGYLHTIRMIGNPASHATRATDPPLTDEDVRIVSYALACAVEEFIEKKAL